MPLEGVEHLGLSATRVSLSHVVDGAFKQRGRPAPIVDCFWGQRMRRLELIAGLGVLGVDRHGRHSTASFHGRLPTPLAGEEILHRGEQEAAKSSARGVRGAQGVLLEQLGEEGLVRSWASSTSYPRRRT